MAADTLHTHAFGTAPAAHEDAAVTPDVAAAYQAHFAYVYRCLRGLGVREAGLDDALQDVFLVVQDKLADFDGKAQLRTWLYAIVVRIARRYRERAAVEAAKFVADGAVSPQALNPQERDCPERALDHNEQLALAARALDALDDDKREVFVLAHVEQMSAPEIAEITGAPLNTIYSRLRAARLAFAAHAARIRLDNGMARALPPRARRSP